MNKILMAATAAALALSATPALAVGPNQNSTATAKIVKPLTLSWVQDLDLGTIVLSGAGTWAADQRRDHQRRRVHLRQFATSPARARPSRRSTR